MVAVAEIVDLFEALAPEGEGGVGVGARGDLGGDTLSMLKKYTTSKIFFIYSSN